MKKMISIANKLYEHRRLISVKVLKVKEIGIFRKVQAIDLNELFENEEIYYLLLLEYNETLEIECFSKDSVGLSERPIVYNAELLKTIKKATITEYNRTSKDFKRKYDILFTVMLYLGLMLDIGELSFNVDAYLPIEIKNTFVAIGITIYFLFFINYLFYRRLRSLDNDRSIFYQFLYFLTIKLFLFFMGDSFLLSGYILFLSLSIFAILTPIISIIRKFSSTHEEIKDIRNNLVIYLLLSALIPFIIYIGIPIGNYPTVLAIFLEAALILFSGSLFISFFVSYRKIVREDPSIRRDIILIFIFLSFIIIITIFTIVVIISLIL